MAVFTPVTKPLKDMVIALATAAGVHCKSDKRFNLAGDFTWRKVPDNTPSSELMVSHGGYDNSDVTTLEFTLGAGGEVCDTNKDGVVDVADISTIISKMASQARMHEETEESE